MAAIYGPAVHVLSNCKYQSSQVKCGSEKRVVAHSTFPNKVFSQKIFNAIKPNIFGLNEKQIFKSRHARSKIKSQKRSSDMDSSSLIIKAINAESINSFVKTI